MLIYVGALGSASVGALVLFLFSLVGVAIPFLAAALLLSRVLPLMGWIADHTRTLGLISMLVIVAFGLVLITNNFHVVSNMIYPLLQLQ
jgi:cytochrome c biogenesis protein CcdA